MAGGPFIFALVATLGVLLLSAGLEDVRRREIANWKNAAIALLAPLWWLANGLPLIQMAILAGVALAVFALFAAAFALGQIGGGDVKLIGALALWLPLQPLVSALVVMALVGGAITIAMVIERAWHRQSGILEIPYGVAIAIAGLIAIREPIFNQIA